MNKPLPICPDTCSLCQDGRHLFHVVDDLGSIWAKVSRRKVNKQDAHYITIRGYVQDEDWLRHLIGKARWELMSDEARRLL